MSEEQIARELTIPLNKRSEILIALLSEDLLATEQYEIRHAKTDVGLFNSNILFLYYKIIRKQPGFFQDKYHR